MPLDSDLNLTSHRKIPGETKKGSLTHLLVPVVEFVDTKAAKRHMDG